MSSRSVLVLAVLALSIVPARAVQHEPPRKIKVTVAPPAPVDTDLTVYFIGVLTRGTRLDDWTRDERRKIQAAQTAYIDRLAREGKLLVAGPIIDGSEWRGIYIFKCASAAEAEALAASDPEVRAGLLKIEVHAWQTEKGAIRDPAFRPGK